MGSGISIKEWTFTGEFSLQKENPNASPKSEKTDVNTCWSLSSYTFGSSIPKVWKCSNTGSLLYSHTDVLDTWSILAHLQANGAYPNMRQFENFQLVCGPSICLYISLSYLLVLMLTQVVTQTKSTTILQRIENGRSPSLINLLQRWYQSSINSHLEMCLCY